jgi:hypothetical protein
MGKKVSDDTNMTGKYPYIIKKQTIIEKKQVGINKYFF